MFFLLFFATQQGYCTGKRVKVEWEWAWKENEEYSVGDKSILYTTKTQKVAGCLTFLAIVTQRAWSTKRLPGFYARKSVQLAPKSVHPTYREDVKVWKAAFFLDLALSAQSRDPAVFVSGSEIARTMNDSRAQIAPGWHHEHIQREKPHQGLCNGDIVLSWWHISNLHRTAFNFSPFSCLYKMWNDVVFVRSRWCKTLKWWAPTDKAHQPICCVIKMMASFTFVSQDLQRTRHLIAVSRY